MYCLNLNFEPTGTRIVPPLELAEIHKRNAKKEINKPLNWINETPIGSGFSKSPAALGERSTVGQQPSEDSD